MTIEPRYTLADTLRDNLNLTGTKVVCDRGSCSACTVWIDKTPALALLTRILEKFAKQDEQSGDEGDEAREFLIDELDRLAGEAVARANNPEAAR